MSNFICFLFICMFIFVGEQYAMSADAAYQCLQWSESSVSAAKSAETLNLTEWRINSSASNPELWGVAVCSLTETRSVGDTTRVGSLDTNHYDISSMHNCWCRLMTSATDAKGGSLYVFAGTFGSSNPCYLNCADACVKNIKAGGTFNRNLFQ